MTCSPPNGPSPCPALAHAHTLTPPRPRHATTCQDLGRDPQDILQRERANQQARQHHQQALQAAAPGNSLEEMAAGVCGGGGGEGEGTWGVGTWGRGQDEGRGVGGWGGVCGHVGCRSVCEERNREGNRRPMWVGSAALETCGGTSRYMRARTCRKRSETHRGCQDACKLRLQCRRMHPHSAGPAAGDPGRKSPGRRQAETTPPDFVNDKFKEVRAYM